MNVYILSSCKWDKLESHIDTILYDPERYTTFNEAHQVMTNEFITIAEDNHQDLFSFDGLQRPDGLELEHANLDTDSFQYSWKITKLELPNT